MQLDRDEACVIDFSRIIRLVGKTETNRISEQFRRRTFRGRLSGHVAIGQHQHATYVSFVVETVFGSSLEIDSEISLIYRKWVMSSCDLPSLQASTVIELPSTTTSFDDRIPQINKGTLLLPLCMPTIAFGLMACILSIWLFRSPGAAFTSFAGSLVGLTTTIWLFRRQTVAAEAVLRCPDLRDAELSQTGVFQSLLAELIQHVHRHELDLKKIAEQRTRLEARTHLLRLHSRRIEHILDELDEPVFVFDAGGAAVLANSAARSLLNAKSGASTSTPLSAWESIEGLRDLVHETRTRSAAADRRTAELNIEISGNLIAYRAQATTIFDDGRVSGLAVILVDIQAENAEKGRQAEFVSSVSHELKTPLASVRAYTELLLDDGEDPEERRELLMFIDDQVIRLTRLVNNLLNYARIESGVIKVNREDVDLNRIMSKSVEVIKSHATEKSITIIEELSDLYLPVHVDTDLFGQATINLLSNAVKYTPAGGEVRLRTRMDETQAVIEVVDNGMGIPAESLPKLFERFYRVPQNIKAAAGTGLGLALVKYIVTNIHDGAIAVTSEVGKGSCFSIRIPLGHRDHGVKRISPGSKSIKDEKLQESLEVSHR